MFCRVVNDVCFNPSLSALRVLRVSTRRQPARVLPPLFTASNDPGPN